MTIAQKKDLSRTVEISQVSADRVRTIEERYTEIEASILDYLVGLDIADECAMVCRENFGLLTSDEIEAING